PFQFCNLSSVICRADDNLATLRAKVEIATMIGTIQSMATAFPFLRDTWADNCREERLLGVDLNGQFDCPFLMDDASGVGDHLRELAILVNEGLAKRLNIYPSAAVTCVKPNGNSSQLVN